MQNIHDLNEIQASILRALFTKEPLKFSELNSEQVPSDQFSYHLRQMLKNGIIQKNEDNVYSLSDSGKSMALLLDTKTNAFIRQGFIALRVVIQRQKNGKTEYLMQQRTKVPFKNYLAEPGGKILFGDDVLVAAERNLENETGLKADLAVKGLVHFKDVYKEKLMQDKYFFVIEGKNPIGELKPFGSTGKNIWLSADEIINNPKTHQGVDVITKMAQNKSFSFVEGTHHTDDY